MNSKQQSVAEQTNVSTSSINVPNGSSTEAVEAIATTVESTQVQVSGGSNPSVSNESEESNEKESEESNPRTRSDGRAYVPKNSLSEEMLIAERDQAREVLRKKRKAEITAEDIARERKTSNRLSEFQSRQRRRKIVDDLKKTAQDQSEHSLAQAKQIIELQTELQAVRQENIALRRELELKTLQMQQQQQQQTQAPSLPLGNANIIAMLAQVLQSQARPMANNNIALGQAATAAAAAPTPATGEQATVALLRQLLSRPDTNAALPQRPDTNTVATLQLLLALSQQQQNR
jgi:hypothetical protein